MTKTEPTCACGHVEDEHEIFVALHPKHLVLTDPGDYRGTSPVAYTPLHEIMPNWRRGCPKESKSAHHHWDSLCLTVGAPPWTTSLDAALTLARDGIEMLVMLNTACRAIRDRLGYEDQGKQADLWPGIRAALITALKARSRA